MKDLKKDQIIEAGRQRNAHEKRSKRLPEASSMWK
jgi:hypothetical protein